MRKISIVLIILGVLVAASPLIGQLYTKYQEEKMIAEWLENADAGGLETEQQGNPEDALAQLQDVFTGDDAIITETGTEGDGGNGAATPKPTKKPAAPQTVLGIIRIDKIKVKAPIVEGVKASNLRAGVGHIPGTAAIGQKGNCALAGHRSYTFGKFFNRLDEMNIGDEFMIITKKEDLRYKVYEKLVVTPDDVSVLKGGQKDSIVTLITCTPIYVASHRLILHAKLEKRVLREP